MRYGGIIRSIALEHEPVSLSVWLRALKLQTLESDHLRILGGLKQQLQGKYRGGAANDKNKAHEVRIPCMRTDVRSTSSS